MGRLAGPAEPRSLGGGHAGLLGLGHQRNGRSRCASATAMLVAHSRGLVDFDAPVARYWPEFAQNGKEGITLRHLLSHQAGLAALDKPLDLVTASDPDARAEVLAAQRPLWEPGTRQGYHAWTFGWCESEVLRRVDPGGRTLGRFFADEVATPLSIEFYIGLPDEIAADRVALVHFRRRDWLRLIGQLPWRFIAAMLNPGSLTSRATRLLPGPPMGRNVDDVRVRAYARAEIPSGFGIGQVRAVARVYGTLSTGGDKIGLRPDTVQAVGEPPTLPSGGLRDLVAHTTDLVFSLGFVKPMPGQSFGTGTGRAGVRRGGGAGMRGAPGKDARIDALYDRLGGPAWSMC